jgi:hypothetical protein
LKDKFLEKSPMTETKTRTDRLIKNILSGLSGSVDADAPTKEILFSLLSKAGRSKDEVIQILGREIGLALAAMLAKPLEQITENKRVRITVELVPKAKIKTQKSPKRKTTRQSP